MTPKPRGLCYAHRLPGAGGQEEGTLEEDESRGISSFTQTISFTPPAQDTHEDGDSRDNDSPRGELPSGLSLGGLAATAGHALLGLI